METVRSEQKGLNSREIVYGILGVVLGLLVLSGVWLFSDRSPAVPTSLSEVAPYDAPAFTLNDLNGNPVSLSDYRGKVVLVNFWGTWCPPCKEETPALESAYSKLKDEGFVILGVDLFNGERSYQRGIEDVRQFAALYGVTYPIVLDETGSAGQAYAIAPLPTSYFIDQQGKVRYIRVGQLSESDVERVFRQLQSTAGSADSG